MYLAQILFGIQLASVFLLLGLSVYIFAKWQTKLQGYLFFHVIVVLVNNAGYLMCMLSKTEHEYLLCLKASYLGRTWVAFSLLLLVISICKQKVSRKLLLGLSFFHILTYILVIFVEYNTLYYSSIEFSDDGIFPCINHGNGIWYNINTFIILVYIAYGVFHLFRLSFIEKSDLAKKRYICVSIGIMCNSVFYVLTVADVIEFYDLTMIGYTINTIFFCIAIFKYNLIDTLQLAKDYCVDELAEGIIVANENGEIEYYNCPAKLIFPELDKDSKSVIETLENLIEKNESFERNDRIYLPQSKEFYHASQEHIKLYLLTDNTEQIRHMEELKKQKEIAEEANASKSAFLSIVSHEIRTPMNAVVGMTELLLRDEDSLTTKQAKYLNNIKNSGASLVMIVNDILDQSKIEAGKMEIVEDVYELRPMVDDVKMIIENRIGTKPIHLVMEIDEQIPDVMVGDSLRIRQILINLMNNAVKFTTEGFIKLSISVESKESDKLYLCFAVQDSGQGINEADLSKLGQAFTQVDVKKNHGKEGTGLGLSISRDFISLMGGQLQVNSTYGKGTTFYFTISQGFVDEEESNNSKVGKAWKDDVEFTAKTARILVVDDSPINLMVINELLVPVELKVDTAESGKDALTYVQANKYDIIFMDYMMPYMNGVEATEHIRQLSDVALEQGNETLGNYYKTVPIIAFSGDSSAETKDLFLRAGIDDMLEKPVDIKRFKKLLLKWLPEDKIVMKE